MTGQLFLSGGGSENQTEEIDKAFLENVENILYIPLAWPNEDFKSCLSWFNNMTSLHKKVNTTMITNENQPVDLSQFDAVYVGGGNTFKLLKKLRESGLEEKLISFYKNGGKIFGGSAGAIIWGNKIDTALLCKDADKNLVKLKDTSGFNEVQGYDIQCHFEDDQVAEHQDYIIRTGRNVIAIPEESALIVQGKIYSVLGPEPITLITAKESKKYNPGSKVPI
jgi:dipeptidase E